MQKQNLLLIRSPTFFSPSVKECLSPKIPSVLELKLILEKEKIYESHRRKPIGTAPKPNLPSHIDPLNNVFGKASLKGSINYDVSLNVYLPK